MLVLCTVLMFLTSCMRERTLSGQVFLAASLGLSLKLGLTTVSAYDYADIQRHLDRKRAEANQRLAGLTPLEKQIKELWQRQDVMGGEAYALKVDFQSALKLYRSAQFYFNEMPKPLASTKTNADGIFTLTVPSNKKLAIAAFTHFEKGDPDEVLLYWLVDPYDSASLTLTNDNATNSMAKASLLRASCGQVVSHVESEQSLRNRIEKLQASLDPSLTPMPQTGHSTVTLRQPVIVSGSRGAVTLPVGMRLPVVSGTSSTLRIRYQGQDFDIPVGATSAGSR
jgi:hypothetical protein